MVEVSSFEIIENPGFVKDIDMPELGGAASLYEDGSVFVQKTGRYYAPEKEDSTYWRMRQEFDASKSIKSGDRYRESNGARRMMSHHYGLVG